MLVVGLVYYVAALIIFRHVLTSIPSILRGESVIVGDELVPYFNPRTQLLEQAEGRFNELTNGYEFRVRYAFLTTWLRHYQVLPFAILIVIPSIFWAVYYTTAKFIDRVFTGLAPQTVYIATAFPTALIYLIMTYAKVTHFYTLVLGLAMMTMSSLLMLWAVLFEPVKWRRWMVLSSVITLFNPAVHYLVLFTLFFAIATVTIALGEFARWIRRGGPARLHRVPRTAWRLAVRRGRWRKFRVLRRRLFQNPLGRCFGAGAIYLFVALVPYALFVKFVALRGVPNLSETVPGDYYFIRDASVSWLHILSWDLAGITDKILFGDYLAKVPRYPNIVYSLLLIGPLLFPLLRRQLLPSRAHRQLLGVVYVSIAFSIWATIGYAEPIWFPTFHRALAGLTQAANATNTPLGGLTLAVTSTIVQVLRFPHRFQLILFMLAPMVMTLSLAVAIDGLSGRWSRSLTVTQRESHPRFVDRTRRDQLVVRSVATLWVASVFFTPFWSNGPYRRVFSSGDMAGFLAPYPVHDLKELKTAISALPDGKTVVLPPTETAKLVTDDNGVDHKFIDKFFIYYLDKPSYYYGLTGDVKNKFEFFLMLRGIYYQQDWWVNIARDLDIRYLVVNRKLRDNRGVGAEYLPDVESYTEPGIQRLDDHFALRFENKTFALYELTDPPHENRPTLLVDSSWNTYLDLVFTRLDLSRCYDFEYLPYFDPTSVDTDAPIALLTDDERTSALDLYLLDHPELIGKPDTKIFAFNPDIIASSYYLSPMFRSFLLFSNTKWNRTEMITPGMFGALRGSFIGVPRATAFDVPLIIDQPGRYHVLLRGAPTINDVEITSASLDYDASFELRSPAESVQYFTLDEVYTSDRVPVDTTRMDSSDLESAIPDRLVPVNVGFGYHDLGVVDAAVGVHKFRVTKSDSNPMLVEGITLIPEAEYEALTLDPRMSVIDDPDELDCATRYPVRSPEDLYVDPAANAEHPDLTNAELMDLAAAGVEDLVPDSSGGVGPTWVALATTSLLLVLSGLVIRWRARRTDDDDAADSDSDDNDDEPDTQPHPERQE
ncbi:MAG: hypothetical protein RL238_691 [Actinomycetota bacterium]